MPSEAAPERSPSQHYTRFFSRCAAIAMLSTREPDALYLEAQLSDECQLIKMIGVHLARRCEHAHRDGKVQSGAFLLDVRRREVHYDTVRRETKAGVFDRRGDSILALLHRRIGQSDHTKVGERAIEVRFNIDDVCSIPCSRNREHDEASIPVTSSEHERFRSECGRTKKVGRTR